MYDKSLEYNSNTQTLIGTKKKTLIDQETGEILQVDQITKRSLGQKQFWKVYLIDFLQILGLAENRQIDVLIYILENTNSSNNTFIGTYKKISKELKVSETTIATIFKKLQNNKFLEKIQNGVYQVSPTILMKGNENKKQILINYYKDDEEKQ